VVGAGRQAHFRAYGTSFGVQASDDEMMAAVRCRANALGWRDYRQGSADVQYVLRRITSQEARGSPEYHLTCDGDVVRSATGIDVLIDAFEDHAKIQTAARARGVLFVHAGAVAWQGHGILIPGRSHAGKSTLVHALLRAGAEYYSDEFALLDADGRVHPYPLPLSLRADGSAPPQRIHAEAIGASTARSATFVDVIVATHYRRRARWRPRPLSKGEALLLLMENTVAARQPPARTMPILRQTVLRATALRSERGEALAAARRLIASMS
jgi:hypothetical protein